MLGCAHENKHAVAVDIIWAKVKSLGVVGADVGLMGT